MESDFDIIVIGSGAGGGTLAAACAAAGRNVLLLERGRSRARPEGAIPTHASHDESGTLIEKAPYDDRLIRLGEHPTRLYMAGVPGGGTSVFGGALVRPRPEDFEPGRYYGDRLPGELHQWPIEFDELAQYFPSAEQLFHVANPDQVHVESASGSVSAPDGDFVKQRSGGAGPDQPALEARESSAPEQRSGQPVSVAIRGGRPLPLADVNQRLIRTARKCGLSPYRLPLAIDADKCLRCDHCAGFPCPTGARRSAIQLVEGCILQGDRLTFMSDVEVLQLKRTPGPALDGVQVLHRTSGQTRMFRAKRYVMAAGAIGSAALLQHSGFEHAQLGRNYMMHYSPIAIGLFLQRTEADRTFIKQIGLSDYYFGTRDLREKMGLVQSLPAPGPLMMRKAGLKRIPIRLLGMMRSRMLPLAGIVEDLPHPENRVTLAQDGGIRLSHRYSQFDIERGNALAGAMSSLLRSTGAVHCVNSRIPSREHVAHQCGTLRFGRNPKTAVADRECRLFDQPDVFVADGSFMPSSLGVGPSLTIISNALRVAKVVASEC